MKKLFKTCAIILIAVMFYLCGGRERVISVFGQNVGLDGFSRAVEVAVMNNPAAAFVFNAEDARADEC